ncbi:TRAP transporter small permease [Comamonadaceae bacterium OH2545_COT-014]|nr:TRAP transporter small permease [Comamonadaceae bacterium OH2545_COT-014]
MRWIEQIEEGLLALLLAGMTLITFMQVVARYAFNYSFVWAMELTSALFGMLIFLGMGYGVRVGAHVGVDLLGKAIGPRAGRWLSAAAALLCMAYALVLAVGGWQYVSKIHAVGILMQDLPLPQWLPRAVLPAGFALLALRFGALFAALAAGRQRQLLGDEAADAMQLRAGQRPLMQQRGSERP